MKFINKLTAAISIIIISMIMSGCTGNTIDRTTWLIVVAEDTITVGDAGEAWNGLENNQKETFTSKDNTVGEYIVTYGRKVLLQTELSAAGYLDDRLLISTTDIWLNEKCGEAARLMLYQREMEDITDDDIDFFLSYLGGIVQYTVNPGNDGEEFIGPVHLPTLPGEMVLLLDSLAIGEYGISESGIEVRLDSIASSDSSLIAQTLADTSRARSDAARTIASSRFSEMEKNLALSLVTDYNQKIDSTAFKQLSLYYAEESESPAPETVIIESDLGSWTASDLKNCVTYYTTSNYTMNPTNIDWFFSFFEFLHSNSYYHDLLEREAPEIIDSLNTEADSYLLSIAAEEFYVDRIHSNVTVTRADMQDLFNNMENPMTIPEKRVLQAIQMPIDSIPAYNLMTPDEQEQFRLRMQGFEYLSVDSIQPQITRPLLSNEIPGMHGDEFFLIDPSDTTSWLGPLELRNTDRMCMFRLIEVIPERTATFEEAEDDLRIMTQNRLEEQLTIEVIRGLEDKFGMVINEDILENLPEDLGTWAEL